MFLAHYITEILYLGQSILGIVNRDLQIQIVVFLGDLLVSSLVCLVISLVLTQSNIVCGIFIMLNFTIQDLIIHLIVLTFLDHRYLFTNSLGMVVLDVILLRKIFTLDMECFTSNTTQLVTLSSEI